MRIEKEIPIELIQMDRWRLRPKAFKYAKLMECGVEFPPIKVARRANGLFEIRDGRHRMTAHKLLGKKVILAKFSEEALKQ